MKKSVVCEAYAAPVVKVLDMKVESSSILTTSNLGAPGQAGAFRQGGFPGSDEYEF